MCAEAAVELLIAHAEWLHRTGFVARFVRVQVDPALVGQTALAWVDWHAAADAVATGQVACSAGEGRVLLIAASIAKGVPLDLGDAVSGLDAVTSVLVARAVLAAGGHGAADDVAGMAWWW